MLPPKSSRTISIRSSWVLFGIDANANDLYDPGEGLSGVTVMPDSGTYFAALQPEGFHPLTVDDDYVVTFSGGGLQSWRTVVIVQWPSAPPSERS